MVSSGISYPGISRNQHSVGPGEKFFPAAVRQRTFHKIAASTNQWPRRPYTKINKGRNINGNRSAVYDDTLLKQVTDHFVSSDTIDTGAN